MKTRLLILVLIIFAILSIAAGTSASRGEWTEGVRVRVADDQAGVVIDFTVERHVSGNSELKELHVVMSRSIPCNSDPNNFHWVNTWLIPVNGPQDRGRVSQNLVSGDIDTIASFPDCNGIWHTFEIHIKTNATPSTHPVTLNNAGYYQRMTSDVKGYLMFDGNLWYDLNHADNLNLLGWNFSSSEPN